MSSPPDFRENVRLSVTMHFLRALPQMSLTGNVDLLMDSVTHIMYIISYVRLLHCSLCRQQN